MRHPRNEARPEGPRELTRIIRRHLNSHGEIVLDTEELGQFLGNGHPLDSVRVQQIIREVAQAQGWRAFVFDYGACVRFSADGRSPSRKPAPARNHRSPRSTL